jgi:WD40 repeat protein
VKSWKFQFDPKQRQIATGCYSIMIYDYDTMEKINEISNDMKYFYSLCFLENNLIATGNSNGAIKVFSTETNKRVHKIEELCMAVRSLAYDQVNARLLSASDDLHINVFDSNKFTNIIPLVGHKDIISNVLVNPDLKIIASSSHDGVVKIWDDKTFKCIQTIQLAQGIIWDISFSNDGKELICGSDNTLTILSLA